MSKVKNLTITALKREDSKRYNQKKELVVNGYKVQLDKVFRQTKVQELLREFVEKVNYVTDHETIDYELVDWVSYSFLLIIKYFTSIAVPNKFEEQIVVMGYLIDNDFLKPILEGFDLDEIEKLNMMFATVAENMEFYQDQIEADFANLTTEDGEQDGDSEQPKGLGESSEGEN